MKNSFGLRLQGQRKQAGLSQRELGKLADTDGPHINHLEHNHKTPTVNTLKKLCGVLGCTASDLLGF